MHQKSFESRCTLNYIFFVNSKKLQRKQASGRERLNSFDYVTTFRYGCLLSDQAVELHIRKEGLAHRISCVVKSTTTTTVIMVNGYIITIIIIVGAVVKI